jgi:hypothetical protein
MFRTLLENTFEISIKSSMQPALESKFTDLANFVAPELNTTVKVKTVQLCLYYKFPMLWLNAVFKAAFEGADHSQLQQFSKTFLNEDLFLFQLQHPSIFASQHDYDPVVHNLNLFELNPSYFLSEYLLEANVLNLPLINVFRDHKSWYISVCPTRTISVKAAAVIYTKLLWDFGKTIKAVEILKTEEAVMELCKFAEAKPTTLLINAFLVYYSGVERKHMEDMIKEMTNRLALFEYIREWQ